jgi:ATP/ADP translocase/HEAT repeat protein
MVVRREERFVTTMMFLYIFGVLTFYYILDPLRKGLFLKSLPASQLPYAYFLTALFAGVVATIVFKLGQRSSAIALLTGTNIAIILTLLYFRWAMGREIWYIAWVYFVYVKIVSVLATTQFWLLAGYIYDSRQAKRIYSLLGAGAAIGALTGSLVPAFLSNHLSTESMILICIAVCLGLVVLSQVAWRYRKADPIQPAREVETPKYRSSDLWKMVFRSKHLSLMVLLIFLTLIASQITDWQVDSAVRETYSHLPAQEMGIQISRFSARLSFITNLISVVIQVFLAGFVVRRFGILAMIIFLPAALFLSSTAILLFPSLIAAAVARGSDTVSRYSVNRSGLELLYLPLAPSVRKELKTFVDVFVDRTGRAVAGVVILLFTSSFLPFGLRGTAAVTVVLTLACCWVCWELRKTYVNSFRQQLQRREVDLGDVAGYVSHPASVRILVDTLESSNERQILYALQLLQHTRTVDFSEQLFRLLSHPSSHVRQEAAHTLAAIPADCSLQAERLLDDSSPQVREAAIDYLCAGKDEARLVSLLNDTRPHVQISAGRWAAEHAGSDFQPDLDFIKRLAVSEGTSGAQARLAAASLAARFRGKEGMEQVGVLLRDPVPQVARAAAVAAAKANFVELLFPVLEMLSRHQTRQGAREALLIYGERIIGTLADTLADPRQSPVLRREIAWVLGRIAVKRSADVLFENLDTGDSLLKYRIAKALNRLHETNPELPTAQSAISKCVYLHTRDYYERYSICESIGRNEKTSSLMVRALREQLQKDLELIFRLLALGYSRREIYLAYNALTGTRADRKTAAIEFLDNVLPARLKSVILPLLEESSPEVLIVHAEQLFGIKPLNRQDALRRLASRPESWLGMCAEHELSRS